jgi:hypothetical protein
MWVWKDDEDDEPNRLLTSTCGDGALVQLQCNLLGHSPAREEGLEVHPVQIRRADGGHPGLGQQGCRALA